MRTTWQQPSRGLTLVELVVVVSILALLASIAVPSMAQFVSARRVEDAARRLSDTLAMGRLEAVKRNSPVLLCADAAVTGSACNSAPAADDWAKGWRLCYDANVDGQCDAGRADDPNPLRVQPAVNAAVRLTGPASRLRFNPDGTVTSSSFSEFSMVAANVSTLRWLVRFAASGAFSARKA